MLKTIRGVVISEVPFKENSKILNIMSEDGIIGVISKGCKNLKSSLRIISNKLVYGDFTIYYNENKLSTLKEGVVVNSLTHIKTDLTLISYLIYLTDLTSQVYKSENNPIIFKLYISTILKIESGLSPLIMSNIYEIKLLDYLGCPINFDSCVKCGSSNDIITFDSYEGGYICKNCYTNQVIYDKKVLYMMKKYYEVEIDSIKELKINDSISYSINDILQDYYDRFTGLYIKSKDFLKRNIKYES